MKKIYFLSLLICFGISAFAQPVTTTIYSSGAALSYTTGNSTAVTRTDNTITTTAATQRGYAVFDLSTIPAGSNVNSVTIGFYCSVYGGAGVASGWNTYGYAGDLSTVTVPATLFADMVAGTSLSTATYGAGVGNQTLISTAASTTFIQNNAGVGSKVSICFTGGGTRVYTFSGETGAGGLSTTLANHVPFITVTYCPPPTITTASAAPNPLCEGDMLTLTGVAAGASGGYSWAGPGGYTSGIASPSFVVTPASAGTYTLTAVNSCTTYSASATATTSIVTVNPLPSAIAGATSVCTGGATSLSSFPLGGDWTSSLPSIASVGSSTGLVLGVASGTTTISYMLNTGCYVTSPMTDNDPPTAISGPTVVCENASMTLTDGVGGGTWTSNNTLIATVNPGTGSVTGVAFGTTTITYVTGGCSYVTYDITVNPAPAPIGGPTVVCAGSTITVTETSGGGTWSSGTITIAMVGSASGIVTGVAGGTDNIIYTFTSTGCQAIQAILVNPLPAAIGGPTDVCAGATMTATDATGGGLFSGGAPNASVTGGGTVSGLSSGPAVITYTETLTGCAITETISVDPTPSAITGPLEVCQNATITLSDTDPGGTWSSGSTVIATVGSASGIVTGLVAATVDIDYTFASGCSTLVTVTVNPAPLSVITPVGATTFCTGNSVVLNGSPGGTTYQWNNLSGPIAGETNSSYTASTTDSFTVDMSNTFGCITRSAPIGITAGITAVVDNSSPLNFCIGNSVTLTANTGSATGIILYQWLMNGAAIPGATFVTYSASASGNYECAINISGGGSGSCLDTTAAVTVLVNSLPTPSVTYTGTALTTGTTYAVYQWYVNTSAIPGATSSSWIPHANGSYRVRVTDGIGCPGFSSAIQITGVGVAQINKTDIKIYPNPANDMIQIESPVNVRAVISGIEGKVVMEQSNVHSMNISSLANGMYILMLYDDKGERLLIEKLVKE